MGNDYFENNKVSLQNLINRFSWTNTKVYCNTVLLYTGQHCLKIL